jgi:hypothetical protein
MSVKAAITVSTAPVSTSALSSSRLSISGTYRRVEGRQPCVSAAMASVVNGASSHEGCGSGATFGRPSGSSVI